MRAVPVRGGSGRSQPGDDMRRLIRGMRTPWEKPWSVTELAYYVESSDSLRIVRKLSGFFVACLEQAPHRRSWDPRRLLRLEDVVREDTIVVCPQCLFSQRYRTEGVARTGGFIHEA